MKNDRIEIHIKDNPEKNPVDRDKILPLYQDCLQLRSDLEEATSPFLISLVGGQEGEEQQEEEEQQEQENKMEGEDVLEEDDLELSLEDDDLFMDEWRLYDEIGKEKEPSGREGQDHSDSESIYQQLEEMKERYYRRKQIIDDEVCCFGLLAGEIALEQEELDAAELFANTVGKLCAEFASKGCEPEVSVPKDPYIIRTDRQGFVQIVRNLVKNALMYGTGGYQFFMAPADGKTCIRISNQADSIGRDEAERIFNPFYSTDKSNHTGIGLNIVREYARQMGGEIWFRLEEGKLTIEVLL